MGNDRVENSNQNSNKHNDVAMDHTGELESETGMGNENDQHVNDEEKPRKTTGQFSAEMEAEQQSSDSRKDDVNVDTSKSKSKKKAAKKSQPGSPALRRVAKAIKIIFMSGTLIVGAGAGYLWASQNGYVAMIKNSLTPEETMSQLDTRQNESITKLQLTITDLKTAMQSLQESNRIEKETSQHERNVFAGKVATLETELQQYERNTNSELSTLKGGVNFANASIKTQEERLQGALEAQSKLTKDTEENSVVINRLQRQLTKFSDKLDVKLEEAKKAVREVKRKRPITPVQIQPVVEHLRALPVPIQ